MLCKCIRCPQEGAFTVGRYYSWLNSLKGKNIWNQGHYVIDEQGEGYDFSWRECPSFFKDIETPNVSVSIYIDRKRELLFVPHFRCETGPSCSLEHFERLSFPYEAEDVGKAFRTAWETWRDHPLVTAEEKEAATPYYKIVTKGKGWRFFADRHWMTDATFALSENEILFEYWYKKKGGSFGRDTTDKHIDRIIKLSADNEALGNAILDVFGEAGVP